MTSALRLGVNIDHVATIRNARGGNHPDPIRAAHVVVAAGADGITAHLREDRRHISDDDITRLTKEINLPLNLEIAATVEMVTAVLYHHPYAVCIVPERREELTTEGGLDVVRKKTFLEPLVRQIAEAGIRVSLFIEPNQAQLEAAVITGAHIVELHTGSYCNAITWAARDYELTRLISAAERATAAGLECHAGHGLSYDTVAAIAALPDIVELNIGHFLIGEAIFSGLENSIRQMRSLINQVRPTKEDNPITV